MPQPTQDELDRRKAYLLHALGWLCGKDADREQLEAGDAQKVSGVIDGCVGQGKIVVPFAGKLTIGHDATVASSSAPKSSEVVALMLSMMPRTQQLRILDELPALFETDRRFFNVPVALLDARSQELQGLCEESDSMLKRLRFTQQTLRRGTVRFERTDVKA